MLATTQNYSLTSGTILCRSRYWIKSLLLGTFKIFFVDFEMSSGDCVDGEDEVSGAHGRGQTGCDQGGAAADHQHHHGPRH